MIYNKSLIGSRFKYCSFDNFKLLSEKHKSALDACDKMLHGETDCVVLTGPVGRGKTHLLVSLARAYNQDTLYSLPEGRDCVYIDDPGNMVVFWPFRELSSAIRSAVMDGSLSVIVEDCQECDLLVIDDLTAENITPFVVSTVEQIIEARYNNEAPIAISSNLSLDDIKDVYGPRIVSRLVDMSGKDCIVFLDADEDYRLKMHRERNG